LLVGTTDSEFNDTTTTTTTDDGGNVSAAERRDAVNDDGSVYGRHCALAVGGGWLSTWYPAARPAFGFVVYYVVPMLLIGVLYGRVVCTLLSTSPQWRGHAGAADRQQLRRQHAARSAPKFASFAALCSNSTDDQFASPAAGH